MRERPKQYKGTFRVPARKAWISPLVVGGTQMFSKWRVIFGVTTSIFPSESPTLTEQHTVLAQTPTHTHTTYEQQDPCGELKKTNGGSLADVTALLGQTIESSSRFWDCMTGGCCNSFRFRIQNTQPDHSPDPGPFSRGVFALHQTDGTMLDGVRIYCRIGVSRGSTIIAGTESNHDTKEWKEGRRETVQLPVAPDVASQQLSSSFNRTHGCKWAPPDVHT